MNMSYVSSIAVERSKLLDGDKGQGVTGEFGWYFDIREGCKVGMRRLYFERVCKLAGVALPILAISELGR